MRLPVDGIFRAVFAIVIASSATGCLHGQPVLIEGTADSVRIEHAADPASAIPLAKKHCAGYERVPVLRSSDYETAIFDCVRR